MQCHCIPRPGQLEGKTDTGEEMANYDSPGLTYDSGVRYDAVSPPQPIKRMAKMKVKLNLRDKSDSELLTFAQQHAASMTNNTNFTTPLPPPTAFTTALTAYQTALGNSDTAQSAAKQATQTKETARATLEGVLTQRGNYVELTAADANDPAAVIESAGFGVKSQSTPSGVPDMVQNLSLTAGDHAGEIDAHWDPISGVKIHYNLQWSPSPATDTSWKELPGSTKSKAVLTGFTSGQQVLVRVRANGTAGAGAWSQVASKFAP